MNHQSELYAITAFTALLTLGLRAAVPYLSASYRARRAKAKDAKVNSAIREGEQAIYQEWKLFPFKTSYTTFRQVRTGSAYAPSREAVAVLETEFQRRNAAANRIITG